MAKVKAEPTVEERLKALFTLQLIDSQIDKIKIVRGELPLEVQDLEDDVAGLETRITKLTSDVVELETEASDKKNAVKEALLNIKKYEDQQKSVRNNREFDALTKEIEFQTLEIELSNKRAKEADIVILNKREILKNSQTNLTSRTADLEGKKKELESIVSETQKEEEKLLKDSAKAQDFIEERLLFAYKKIRGNVRNGLAVVGVDRDACGGCFNKIPPQRQLDIRTRKKIAVCEHCGRILVDNDIAEELAGVKA